MQVKVRLSTMDYEKEPGFSLTEVYSKLTEKPGKVWQKHLGLVSKKLYELDCQKKAFDDKKKIFKRKCERFHKRICNKSS
jgi:hypothetical protein